MLNHAVIQGRLTRDPELRTTQNGISVVSFTLANDNDFGEKHTDFIDCVAGKGTAEFVNKYFSKGQMALVTGRLQSRKWKDKNGNDRISWEIQVNNVYFGEAKKQTSSAPDVQYEEIDEDDGELPF